MTAFVYFFIYCDDDVDDCYFVKVVFPLCLLHTVKIVVRVLSLHKIVI